MTRAGLLALLVLVGTPAAAQPIRCSAFLHEHDGSWRSFEDGTVLAPRGPVPVATGERFSLSGTPAQRDVARALDAFCLGSRAPMPLAPPPDD